MGRIVITKAEAERMIAGMEEAEAKGFKVVSVNFGDGRAYPPEKLYQIRDKGGIVLTTPDETPPIQHILSVPNGAAYYCEDDYTQAVKAVVQQMRCA